MSLSARRAWIEIISLRGNLAYVDCVALRKESVDRNSTEEQEALREEVALRKESVDRNVKRSAAATPTPTSLSARRAWIEI
mgnify:CR=1 FL=1